MKWYQSALLGAVQGLTEFLPVSSTAHLNLVRQKLHWPSPGMVLDTTLHLGTLLATLAWMWQEEQSEPLLDLPLVAKVCVATLPAGLAGLFLEKWIERHLRSPHITSAMLIAGGGLLWFSEQQAKAQSDLKQMSYQQAFGIGLAQMLALIPGLSRSGITMTAGLISGLKRPDAVRFSFLMSIPIVAASGLFKLKDIKDHEQMTELLKALLSGGFTAAVFGFVSLEWFLSYVKASSLKPFAAYRILLGLKEI